MSVIAFVSCGNKLAFNSFIGKWDMTNDKESSVQKIIEIKDGIQDAYISGSTLHFKGGQWKLIDEAMDKLLESSN